MPADTRLFGEHVIGATHDVRLGYAFADWDVCIALHPGEDASPERGFLIITHYQRILNHIKPDKVHVMIDGKIVRSGGPELALELEAKGYEGVVPGARA